MSARASVDRDAAPGRTFLVGCPRSGTTLLQSLLFGHPNVISFPETFFFVHALNAEGKLHSLGLASVGAQRGFESLAQLGLIHPGQRRRWAAIRTERGCARTFTRALDGATARADKALWLEKTPSHLHRVTAIERYVPRAKFVHIIRRGTAVVASLYDVTHRHTEAWGEPRDIDDCAKRWQHDVRASLVHVGKPNHAFVAYEDLVADPDAVLMRLCGFLADLAEHLRTAPDAKRIRGLLRRTCKAGALERRRQDRIVNRNDAKLELLFAPHERERIAKAVAHDQNKVDRLPFV